MGPRIEETDADTSCCCLCCHCVLLLLMLLLLVLLLLLLLIFVLLVLLVLLLLSGILQLIDAFYGWTTSEAHRDILPVCVYECVCEGVWHFLALEWHLL